MDCITHNPLRQKRQTGL